MSKLVRITLRRLALPLVTPYRLSYRTFESFEPFMIEVVDDNGRRGFADGHISPGSSSETREGGWAFLTRWCDRVIGLSPAEARAAVLCEFTQSKVACTTLVSAIEVLEGNALLHIPATTHLPLLAPVNATQPAQIAAEIAAGLERGFRTFKVKVGKDVADDLARTALIQAATRDKATLRLDANRAYSRDDALAFVRGLKPDGIALFEQPCHADDWEANGAIAAQSPVPLMLDEPICTLDDIARAADMRGVGFCKLKLKRFGGLDLLAQGLDAVRAHGMEWVLGDGLGSEIHSWLESCVARTSLNHAGEFNGFLKPRERLLDQPLAFANGQITLPQGYAPQPDPAVIERLTLAKIDYTTERTPHGA